MLVKVGTCGPCVRREQNRGLVKIARLIFLHLNENYSVHRALMTEAIRAVDLARFPCDFVLLLLYFNSYLIFLHPLCYATLPHA
jgi:hypothetical protein